MSVKVGFPNSKYDIANLKNTNNTLVLDSFNDSNVIFLNNSQFATSNALINYRNIFASGLLDDQFIIKNINNDTPYISIDKHGIEFNNDVNVTSNLRITGNVLANNAVDINMINEIDHFCVTSCNELSPIQFITNDFSIKNTKNNNRIRIDDINTYISSNIYINNGGVLYVDKISSIGNSLTIENAKYDSTSIESMTVTNNLFIQNTFNTPSSIGLYMLKKKDANNIIKVESIDFNTNDKKNSLTLNPQGLLGLNTSIPDSFLTISGNNSNNIIKYDGTNNRSGNLYHITKEANVCIGTSIPKGQLHIKRIDDRTTDHDIRKDPMIVLDIEYDSNKNTSNVYTNQTTGFSISDEIRNVKLFDDGDLYLLNTELFDSFVIAGNLANLKKIKNNQNIVFETERINIIYDNFDGMQNDLNIQLYIPKKFYTNTNDGIILNLEQEITYNEYVSENSIILYPINVNPGDSGFTNSLVSISETIQVQRQINTGLSSQIVTLNFSFQIHSSIMDGIFKYQTFETVILNPPKFMEFSYNNIFKGSLSHNGTLALGTREPYGQNYLLYAPGKSLLNTLYVNSINTEEVNKIISFNNNHIQNIATVSSSIVSTNYLTSSNATVHNLFSSNIICSNINISNLTFQACRNDYLSFVNTDIQIKTLFSLNNEIENCETCSIISVKDNVADNGLLNSTTGSTIPDTFTYSAYKKNYGLVITNFSSAATNPTLSIKTTNENNIPCINLQNPTSEYNMRLVSETEDDNNITKFQILDKFNRNFNYFTGDNDITGFLQHTTFQKPGKYKVLSFGEQHILCIDTTNKKEIHQNVIYNNFSSKISIGLPFASISSEGLDNKTYVQNGFKDIVDNSEYLLNVYGNVSLSDICKNPMLTLKSQETSVNDNVLKIINVGINCEPESSSTLKVNGNISCDELKLGKNNLLEAITDATDWSSFKALMLR